MRVDGLDGCGLVAGARGTISLRGRAGFGAQVLHLLSAADVIVDLIGGFVSDQGVAFRSNVTFLAAVKASASGTINFGERFIGGTATLTATIATTIATATPPTATTAATTTTLTIVVIVGRFVFVD